MQKPRFAAGFLFARACFPGAAEAAICENLRVLFPLREPIFHVGLYNA